MFSSKIIRGGAEEPRPITLGPLGGIVLPGGNTLFVPLLFASASPAAADPASMEPAPAEPAAVMPEEEALERIEAAYQEGAREGRREAEAELASVSEGLAKGVIAVSQLRQDLLHDAEEDLLKLAVAIARAIILREITLDPALLAGMVQGAVEVVSECDEAVVRLNPADHAVVARSREFAQLSSEKRRITLKPDPAVEPGGCLVETVRGNVDARLESQLEEMYRRLAEERSARRDDTVEPH